MRPWRKICCPVDLSDTSRTALQQAAYLASVFDGSVTAVHVYDPPLETGDAPLPVFDLFEKLRPELEQKLAGWTSEVEESARGAIRSVVFLGNPPAEILRFARESGFDVIVMGTHGRTGLRHLLLASGAAQGVRHAECPVVVTR